MAVAVGVAADPPTPAKDKDKPPAKETKGRSLEPGKDLPGPFHPFNATGPRKGNFHCLVSQHGLDPMLLLFVRELQFSDSLKDLLRRVDNAIAKNPDVRLACAVVFLSEDLPDTVQNDDKREELAQKLADLANDLKLKHVILCLDGKADLEKYDLDRQEAAFTLVLYRKLRILDSESIARDQLTPEKVDAILKLLADKVGAKRK
jgi:hypothetical protein